MAEDTQSIADAAQDFNFWDPQWGEDPYPMLEHLRQSGGVTWSNSLGGCWVASSYAAVHTVLSNPRTFSSRQVALPPLEPPLTMIPIALDHPDHGPYRRIFTPLFAPNRIQSIVEDTRALARELLVPIANKGSCEFLSEFAIPLPCTVFLKILGLPLSDFDRLFALKEAITKDISGDDKERRDHAMNTIIPEISAYFTDVLDGRAADPDPPDDVLSRMVYAEVAEGRPMTRDEMINALFLIFSAGLDTVTGVLGLSLQLLASRPDLRRQLLDEPSILPTAVEELLRYWGIVTLVRQANFDTVLEGVSIKAGDYVAVITPSANRDEIEFDHPERIDFHRAGNRHVAFGAGPHRCLGSHLARMELSVALEEIHAVLPEYRLNAEYSMPKHFGAIMELDELHLTFGMA